MIGIFTGNILIQQRINIQVGKRMSEFVLQNIGAIVVLAITTLVACIGLIALGSWLIAVWEKHIAKVEYRGAQKFGERLITGSWWFSEDPATSKLLHKIGENATLGYGFDVSQIRDLWREDRNLK